MKSLYHMSTYLMNSPLLLLVLISFVIYTHDVPETIPSIYAHVTKKMRQDANERIRFHFADL